MFKQALEQIVERVEGSLGALIMGTDGIHVERFLTKEGKEANLDVAAAEFTSLVRSAQRSANDLGLGALREFVFSFQEAEFVVRQLSKEYFVLLAIKPNTNLGRSRFELRKVELDLAREFAV